MKPRIIVVFIIIMVFLGGCDSANDIFKSKYNGRTAEEWYYQYKRVEAALQRTNDEIETAKIAAGGDYYEMQDDLDNLEPVQP